jgi:hypothetical protein
MLVRAGHVDTDGDASMTNAEVLCLNRVVKNALANFGRRPTAVANHIGSRVIADDAHLWSRA